MRLHPLARYALGRLGEVVGVMLAVSFLVYLVLEHNAADVAVKVLGGYSAQEQRALWLHENGYDAPFLLRYVTWLGHFLRGQWGSSTHYREEVAVLLPPYLAQTGILAGLTFALMVPLSFALGIAAGVREGSLVDRVISFLCVFTTSIPEFASAVFLSAVFVFWLGVLPVLPVLYLRRLVDDPAVYLASRRAAPNAGEADFLVIFAQPLLLTTVLASLLCGGMLGAYYAVTTWLPTYLATERHLSVAGTTGYLLILISGSFAGYLTNAWACDRLGRRLCFSLFAVCGIAAILAYTHVAVDGALLLALGFPLGFFNSGIMAGCGAYLAELYPTAVRGSGQGFSYNSGRALGALCPALIGRWSQHGTLPEAISLVTVGAYLVVILAAWALPETRGRAFTAVPDGVG